MLAPKKLCAYIINGQPINEIDNYYTYQLGGNSPYIIEDTVLTGYQEITSIESLDRYGLQTGKDYKIVRWEMILQVVIKGWTNLSVPEKTIASTWFAVEKAQRDEVHTLDEQIANGMAHHENSRKVRYDRHTIALMEVLNRLSKVDSQDMLLALESNNLLRLYVEYGIEGVSRGDTEGIVDFLNSEAGTSYASNGLIEKAYTPVSGTLTELKDKILDIIINGV
jgi:hypothetical protein